VAVTRRVIQAPADHVFAVLADGWTYSDWVVGTAHIRDVALHYRNRESLRRLADLAVRREAKR
jgi:hypothetical protein